MKHVKLLALILAMILLCGACAQTHEPNSPSPSTTPDIFLGAAGEENSDQGETDIQQQPDDHVTQDKNNRLYDPSIYVIEASGAWHQEITDGYYADYECELYLHKVDSNDNRSSAGVYTGFFWLNMTLDTGGFVDSMLGDVPVDMGFAAGGEGICDNIGFSLTTRDEWERSGYAIPLMAGGEIVPAEDVLMDKGSLIVVAKQVYLDAVASGIQGETVEHHDSQATDVELSYVVHMQPDAYEQDVERGVTIYFSDGQGMSFTIFGTMRRLPGYPDDVLQYTQDAPYQEALNQHLE